LFERSHGKIALTSAGNVVLDYAERILGLSAELETRMGELTGEVGGLLMLGASTTIADYILPRMLGEFKRHYQQVQPRLMVGNSEAIEKAVAEHALDVGLIESPSHQPNLHTEVCCEDELVVIVARDHELAGRSSVTSADLVSFPFVSREPGSGTKEFTDGYFQRAGVAPDELDVVMELGSPEAVKGVVASGLGFAVMSRATVAQELKLGTLAAVPLQPRLIRILSVVYPREKFRSRLLNVFVDFALSRLKAARE
jgi:DNA-binding transcriptional LysR family regulator